MSAVIEILDSSPEPIRIKDEIEDDLSAETSANSIAKTDALAAAEMENCLLMNVEAVYSGLDSVDITLNKGPKKKRRSRGRTVIKCPHCEYSTIKNAHLMRHIGSVHRGIKPFTCPHCDYTASEKGNLNKHVAYVHLGAKPYTCQLCNYATGWKRGLNRHVKIHEKPLIESLLCPLCSYSARNDTRLKVHMVKVHQDGKPFKCALCNYEATWRRSLRRHIAARHRPEISPLPLSVQIKEEG